MIRYNLNRRQQKQVREFRAKATKDIAYFVFCGVVFSGIVGAVSPTITAVSNSLASFVSTPINNSKVLASTLGPSVEPTPIPQAETWEDFKKSAEEIAPIYNYPVQLLLSQAAHESNRGLSQYAQERNNYFGMCAYDWNPDSACWYENEKQGIISYILNIRDTFPEAWEQRDNPEEMLRLLQNNSRGNFYASDPNYVSKVMNTPEWRSYK